MTKPLALCLLLICAIAALSAVDEYFPPPDSQGGWRQLTDPARIHTQAAMNRRKLDQAFEYASRTSQHGGLLVARHGWLVYERYYGRGHREAIPTMASVGKAFTSVACGIMLHEFRNRLPAGLDTRVFNNQFLPEALPVDDPRKADITLGQLLTMSAGLHGDGTNPGFVNFEPAVKLDPLPRPDPNRWPNDYQDQSALHQPLWTSPGGGYSYASNSPHIASIVLRNVTGMEMQEYIDRKLAKPMGWGRWGYGMRQGQTKLAHTPGGGSIAARSTDALRFAYLLLHHGKWHGEQLVPADYVAACSRPSPYQKHAPFSLMFEVNADGHVAGAPRDAYFKSGAGGFGIYIIPSLDLVIYKMAGNDSQYDPEATGLAQTYPYDGSRDGWHPSPHTQFNDGPIGVDDGVRRTLEMVVAAIED
jgi:CubicO group peptidase (beta-lactamase class C family)